MLLELTSTDNLPVFINPYMVESITQLAGNTMIGMASGDQILVNEDAAEVSLELDNLIASHQGAANAGSMH